MYAEALVDRLARTEDPIDLMAVARALAALGAEAKGAARRLEEMLCRGDAPHVSAAAFVVAEIGKAALETAPGLVAALRGRLSDPSAEVRLWAVVALGRFGSAAKETALHLVERLRDPDKGVRLVSAQALGNLGRDVGDAKIALAELLHDNDEDARMAAAAALEKIRLDGVSDETGQVNTEKEQSQ